MTAERFRIVPFVRTYDRSAFDCGEPALDRYLQRQAGQDQRRGVARVFLLIDQAHQRIAGYYTLSATSIVSDTLPEEVRRTLPGYEHTPALLIGRLAVDNSYQGQGTGRSLLMDALLRARTVSFEVAVFAVVVDVKDDRAVHFYQRFGFLSLPDSARRLFLPMRTIEQLFSS
jgi:ribosomal protein S18 acetylase RimI-like enzyme